MMGDQSREPVHLAFDSMTFNTNVSSSTATPTATATATATAPASVPSTASTSISPHSPSTSLLRPPESWSQLISITAGPSPPLSPSPPPARTQHHHLHHQRGKLDLSPENTFTRQELLREAYFPDWQDDASSADLSHPDEMQKKDPLATQIWKLYSRTKAQLPNHERMENLSWRMMAMNLKKREREQAR